MTLTLLQQLFSFCTIALISFGGTVRPDANGCWSSSHGTISGSACLPPTGWQWAEQLSRGACIRCGDELAAEADSWSDYPYRGRSVRRRRNVRRLVHGSCLIVYRISESNRLIEILRFWHGARGVPRLR